NDRRSEETESRIAENEGQRSRDVQGVGERRHLRDDREIAGLVGTAGQRREGHRVLCGSEASGDRSRGRSGRAERLRADNKRSLGFGLQAGSGQKGESNKQLL